MDTNLIEQVKKAEEEIQKAKLETNVYKRQLEELLPARKKMESTAEEDYGCKIEELPAYKEKLELELAQMINELENDIIKAKNDNPEED